MPYVCVQLPTSTLLPCAVFCPAHRPDTMFSYDHATGVMYTCDAFGMHYCSEDAYDVDITAIMPHYRFVLA